MLLFCALGLGVCGFWGSGCDAFFLDSDVGPLEETRNHLPKTILETQSSFEMNHFIGP